MRIRELRDVKYGIRDEYEIRFYRTSQITDLLSVSGNYYLNNTRSPIANTQYPIPNMIFAKSGKITN